MDAMAPGNRNQMRMNSFSRNKNVSKSLKCQIPYIFIDNYIVIYLLLYNWFCIKQYNIVF